MMMMMMEKKGKLTLLYRLGRSADSTVIMQQTGRSEI
jgi:hypothetical protein